MIKGKKIQPKVIVDKPLVNYRKLDALNQSMLKLFDSDPIKFYEEFKLGKKRRDKKNTAIIIGDLVDFYLLGCRGDEMEFNNRLDEKFVLFDGNKGTGQVYILADYIFEEAEAAMNDKGEITSSFDTMFTAALAKIQQEGKYKGKDKDKVLQDFYENGKDYYDKKIDNIGKTVVDASLVDKARTVAEKLMTDEFTKNIFKGNDDLEYLTHFAIEWKYLLPMNKYYPCKSEVDILLIDHDHRIIQPMDLKTTYDNESFDYMYIKNSYYLQNAFYVKAVEEWAKESGIGDYEVRPMTFIVGDTSFNNRRPLIYETSNLDVEKGMFGFSLRGTYYKGVDELINDIVWAEEQDIWNCSRDAYGKNGKMKLNIKYDGEEENFSQDYSGFSELSGQ